MIIKHWHRDGKKSKRERLAPAKLKAIKAKTKQLSNKYRTANDSH
jgi:hypothetical protein